MLRQEIADLQYVSLFRLFVLISNVIEYCSFQNYLFIENFKILQQLQADELRNQELSQNVSSSMYNVFSFFFSLIS